MTALPGTPAESSNRSTLVSVIAWVLVAYTALVTLGALLGVYVLVLTPAATVDAVVNRVAQDTTLSHVLPAPYLFILHHVHLVAFIKLAWWTTALVVSIGVLRRREWARKVFVIGIGIEIVLVLGGIVMGQAIGMALARELASRSQSGQVPPGMGTGLALGGLLGFAIVAILVWVLVTFRSARVRQEFAGTWRAA